MSWWETRKALEFTVVSEIYEKKGHKFKQGKDKRNQKNYVATSIMPNMNITYKMPHVSTNYIAT